MSRKRLPGKRGQNEPVKAGRPQLQEPPLEWLRLFHLVGHHLRNEGAPSLRELSRALHFSPTFLARFLDKLETALQVENRSIVSRPEHGQTAAVSLTAGGERLLKQVDNLL